MKIELTSDMDQAPFKRGKVKDIYDLGNGRLLFLFTDRISAYDTVLPTEIPRKGEVKLRVEPVMAQKLPQPTFDPTTKSDVKDEPITMEQILDEGCLSTDQLEELRTKSLNIYRTISERAEGAGFILADLKLEFGFDEE